MNEKSTLKDKLKLTGSWIADHKVELAVASVVTGAIIYAAYKGQKQKTPPEVPETIGKMLPIKEFLSTADHNYRWGLAMYKYDGDGNEVSLFDVADQLINGDYDQVDYNINIFGGES